MFVLSTSVDDAGCVIVEGGHITLNRTPIIAPDCDVLVSQVRSESPPLPFEVFRAPASDDPTISYVVFMTPDGRPFHELPQGCIAPLMSFEMASATELATLRCALDEWAEARAQGEDAIIRILIGDLGLPPELRREAVWLLPQRYREMLAGRGVSLLNLALESRCRNSASRRMRERAKRLFAKADTYSQWYSRRGAGLMRIGSGGRSSIYLISDLLTQPEGTRNPAIPLTGYGTHPSCAAVFAAGLIDLAESGVRRCSAFYDFEDDPSIADKLQDGVFLAAHFAPDHDLTCRINVLRHGEPYLSSEVMLSDLRRPGRPNGFGALVEKAAEMMRRYNTDWFAVGKTGCETAGSPRRGL